MIQGHGGNIYQTAKKLGCNPDEIIDMSSNLNPMGPPQALIEHLIGTIKEIARLPEVDAKKAVDAFAAKHALDPACVLACNGTTQAIYVLPKVLNAQKVVIVAPTYADYADACRMHGIDFKYFLTGPENGFRLEMEVAEKEIQKSDTVFICNPNNPTGTFISGQVLMDLCRRHPKTNFIIDESYLPFVPQYETESMVSCGLKNVLVLNSMSKIFSVPGLRIGFIIALPEIINRIKNFQLPWAINSLAQAAIMYLSENKAETEAYVKESVQLIEEERRLFYQKLSNINNMHPFESTTSFVLLRLQGRYKAEEICAQLLKNRLLIRDCSNFQGLNNEYIRISLKQNKINKVLIDSLGNACD